MTRPPTNFRGDRAAVSTLGYLDVGSTSMIASAVAAGFAGIVTFFKVGGRKMLGGLSRKKTTAVEADKS